MTTAALSPTLPLQVPYPPGLGMLSRDPYAPTPEETKRTQEMARAWDAYQGVFKQGDAQWPLVWEKGRDPNPNVIINRCGPAVDTDVAWLFGQSVGIQLVNAPQAAQVYLSQAWGVDSEDSSDDDKMSLLQDLATNGAITGHAFLKIVWDTSGNMDFPVLVVLDSTQVRIITDPQQVKKPVCYVIEYKVPDPSGLADAGMATFREVIEQIGPDGNPLRRAPIGKEIVTWQVCDYLRTSQMSMFTRIGPTLPWPYPWPPIEDCPHLAVPNRCYGRPRIPPNAISINENICTVASNIMTIALRHGGPILYTIKTGANQREIRTKPGAILEVASDIKAVQAYGDIKDMMQQELGLRQDFDEQTHIPAQAFGRMEQFPRLPVSGVAFRLSFGALMSDIAKEHRTYGALIRRVSQHMLELKNPAWKDLEVQLSWPNPMPADDLQQAQVGQLAQGAGASKKTVLEKFFNLDWDTEAENLADEQAEAALVTGGMLTPVGQGVPPGGTGSGSQPGGQPQQGPGSVGPPPPPGPTGPAATPGGPPINHPAAAAARAAMKTAVAGKTGKGKR